MDNVAGTIRIDLLASAAQFNAGLREGGQGMGSFADEYEKHAGRIRQSAKALDEELQKRRSSWVEAMRGVGGPLRNVDGMIGAGPNAMDQATRNEVRHKEMVPWGMSYRTELSREAAATAAAIGEESQTVVKRLSEASHRMTEVGRIAFGKGAMRPVGEMLGATEGFSLATKGIGLFTAGLLVAHEAAAGLGEEINRIREEAIKAGMTYDRFVVTNNLPQHSRLVEGGALPRGKGRRLRTRRCLRGVGCREQYRDVGRHGDRDPRRPVRRGGHNRRNA